ncbi:MAG: cell division protein FtsZ [Paracoccaceae bacterium]|tara:strand:- start:8626 stop:10245 length:1620 start_codon:yes stop_codon:yes gene_type:complete
MTLNLSVPGQNDLKPRISVFGIGGAGGNAVNNMIEKELEGADFVAANTDAQALQQSNAKNKIQMGVKVTEGLGAGARASVGAAAAEETIEEIVDHLAGSHMAFITAGMGGGTGTGAAPIIAQAARELGVLTVGVVTKPFQFEGSKRMKQAEDGVEALQKVVDTLIIIPNQNLFRIANEKTTFSDAFNLADDVLYQGVKGITDLMVRPGLINLDFADVRAVMDEMGKAMMGTGEASGEDRAVQSAEKAIANPLLDEISLRGARGVLINITGGHDLTLFELDEAANRIREEVDPDANIIVGSTIDEELQGIMRVSVVATGIDATEASNETPLPRRSMAEPLVKDVENNRSATDESSSESQNTLFNDPNIADQSEMDNNPEGELQVFPESSIPEPIYQPESDVTSAPMTEEANDEDLLRFIPPMAPESRVPSQDTLKKLQDVVGSFKEDSNVTGNSSLDNSKLVGDDYRDDVISTSPVVEKSQFKKPQKEPSRFGINKLINRMTGSSDSLATKLEDESEEAEMQSEFKDTTDIPAFLRRQAN